MRAPWLTGVAILILLGETLLAQGSYSKFGSGCPGTGIGKNPPGLILPAALRIRMAGSGNYYGVGRAQQRYQQVFLGSEAPQVMLVTGYALRHIHANPGGTQTYKVTMGYTTYTYSTITGNFAANFNARGPGTLVFQGTVKLPTLTGTNRDVNRFPFQVKFTRAWVYTPKAGHNILWQLENLSSSNSVQGYDAGNGLNTTRIYANTLTASTGTIGRNYGLAFKLLSSGIGNAIPGLSNTGLPSRGQKFSIDLTQARANTAAGLLTGVSRTKWGSFSLPLDLTPLGAAGCRLLVSMDVLEGVSVGSAGQATIQWAIPNDARLKGVTFFHQFLVLDPSANQLGFAWSNGAQGIIG